MPKLTRGMGVILIVMIVMTGALLYLNSRRSGEVQQDLPLPVVALQPETGSLSTTVRLTGVTESRSLVTVLPRTSGALVEWDIAMGDTVGENQILGRIDPESYDLNLSLAQAALSGAEATYRRVESLFKTSSVPRQNFDEALAAYEAAKAQYDLAALNREWADIRSPISGTVLESHVERGALVSPQVPLVTVADLHNPELRLDVPESYYGTFSKGGDALNVRLTLPALGDRNFGCRIRNIAPWVSPESKTFKVELSVDDPDFLIRPGMFATVLIRTSLVSEVPVLGWEVMGSDGGLWYLEDGNIPRRMEYIPSVKGDEGFLAPSGMEHTFFIAEGQHFLTEGVPVKVVEP